MVVSPDRKEYAVAQLSVASTLGGTRTVSAVAQGGVYPNANVPSSSTTLSVEVTEQTAGISPPSGEWYLAAIEDATDTSGDYTGGTGAGILDIVDLGTGGSLSTSVQLTIGKQGHFRLVLMVGDSDANSQDATAVDTGGTSSEYHFDTDGNSAEGGLNGVSTNGDLIDGYTWRNSDFQSYAYSAAGNLRYGQQFDITTDVSGNTLINPKAIKVALRSSASDGAGQDGVYRPTPTTVGVSTTVTINVDTDWVASPTDYYIHIGVNDVLGDSSTPAGETPDFLSSGTISGTSTSQRAWIHFDDANTGHSVVSNGNRIVSTTADKRIGSGITIYQDAGVTPGAVSFEDAGYATTGDLFRRPFPSSNAFAIPYLQTYVYDAYGSPLNGTDIRAEVRRQTDAGADDGQNLTTDANGRIRWNYTVSVTDAAFNRFVKPGAARQTGSHQSTGPDDESSPPASFSGAASDHPTHYTGPWPAYPRRIWVSGNEFSGTKEPTDQADDVFGINSELHVLSMWTGSLTAANLDANGVPTGAGRREQPLGSGSLKAKVASYVDEGTVTVETPSDVVVHDVAGRDVNLVGTDEIFLRRALWSLTFSTIEDAGTNLSDSQTALEPPLASKAGNNSLDSIASPTDPSSLAYYQGFASTTAQRSTFALTTDETDVGFTSDSGVYGYFRQPVSFFAIDLSITAAVTPEVVQSDPTLVVRVGIKVLRVTTDNHFVEVTPDEEPLYAVYGLEPDGTQTQLVEGSATATGTPSDFYADVTIPSPANYKAIKVIAFAKVNGSRTPGGDGTPIQVGYVFDPVGAFVGFPFK